MIGPVADNLALVHQRLEAVGGGHVTVVAVTKGFGAAAIDAARQAGLADIGESYAQELVSKRTHLESLSVHFVGRLQRNKVRAVSGLVDLWQSVDRSSIAREIALRSPGAAVLVQVNAIGDPGKGGCEPGQVDELVDHCRALGLEVRGLMTVGAMGSVDVTRAAFETVRSAVDRLGLAVCSMGMSDDLEAAVAAGTTMVRVGSALFGPRPTSLER